MKRQPTIRDLLVGISGIFIATRFVSVYVEQHTHVTAVTYRARA
jgi:hypothetical protein